MSSAASTDAHEATARGFRWLASVAIFGILPCATVLALFAATIQDGTAAIDFRQLYRAADAIVNGENPFPAADALLTASGRPYVYPPFPALVTTPLTFLPLAAAELIVMASLVAAILATLAVLGVRDWRCYGLVLLWPPVLSAVQTGNVTLWFGLALAIVWRFRDRPGQSAASLGVTLATKFLLWPIVLWMAATRRLVSAALSVAVGVALLFGSWAAIGFTGLRGYPELLQRLDAAVGADAYTLNNVALDLGMPAALALSIWLAVGLSLLATMIVVGVRGDERRAFVLATASALALSPLVWLHYFALLVVVVGLTQRKLGLAWFVPLAMLVCPGSGNPTVLEALVALAAVGLTVALAMRAPNSRRASAPSPLRTPMSAGGET